MAYFNVSTVTTATTNNMSTSLGAPAGSPQGLYNPSGTPTFVRNSPTVYTYTWDANGRITAIGASANGPAVPAGCAVSG